MKGLWVPTCRGEEWIYPVLGPYHGDLQELLKVSRKFCSNFEHLSQPCNTCQTPGWNLELLELKDTLKPLNQQEIDELINQTVEAIISNNRTTAAQLKKKLKEYSLYPVPVLL